MTWYDVLAGILTIALASGAIVDIWLNGSIFAALRARVEIYENAFSELMGCSLCLTYQAAIWLTLGLWLLPMFMPWWAALLLHNLLVVLAAGRLAWVINAWLGPEHNYDRGGHDAGEENYRRGHPRAGGSSLPGDHG
jgi:hypothetical protein